MVCNGGRRIEPLPAAREGGERGNNEHTLVNDSVLPGNLSWRPHHLPITAAVIIAASRSPRKRPSYRSASVLPTTCRLDPCRHLRQRWNSWGWTACSSWRCQWYFLGIDRSTVVRMSLAFTCLDCNRCLDRQRVVVGPRDACLWCVCYFAANLFFHCLLACCCVSL